jgi:hypothetical protein
MLYVVEIRRDREHLAKAISAIREWLDARRSEPELFRCDTNDQTVIFRLEFKSESEAVAVAESFSGERIR